MMKEYNMLKDCQKFKPDSNDRKALVDLPVDNGWDMS